MNGWSRLKRHFHERKSEARLIVGLDFDGTIAPMARRPDLAALPPETRRLLRRLARKRRSILAVVSGRSLADLRRRVQIPGAYLAGNHGLEIEGPGLSWTHPGAEAQRPRVRDVAAALGRVLKGYPGFHLEDKGLTLSIHYRLARQAHLAEVRAALGRIVALHGARLRLAHGKKVWEIRQKFDWNKGHALLKISEASGHGDILFVGDDRTDEEGFRSLGRRALTVRVGAVPRTSAKYRVRGMAQVRLLLEVLCRNL